MSSEFSLVGGKDSYLCVESHIALEVVAESGACRERIGVDTERRRAVGGVESVPRDLILKGAGRSGVSGGYLRSVERVECAMLAAELAFLLLMLARRDSVLGIQGDAGLSGVETCLVRGMVLAFGSVAGEAPLT